MAGAMLTTPVGWLLGEHEGERPAAQGDLDPPEDSRSRPPDDGHGGHGDDGRYVYPVVVPPREIPGMVVTDAELRLRDLEARQGHWARPWCTLCLGAALGRVDRLLECPTGDAWLLLIVLVVGAVGFGLAAWKPKGGAGPPSTTLGLAAAEAPTQVREGG